MDITTVFGTVIEGSNPPESTIMIQCGFAALEFLVHTLASKITNWFDRKDLIKKIHCGYGLVVEHVLAKHGAGFRLPLPAHLKKSLGQRF